MIFAGTTFGTRFFNDIAVGPNFSWEIDFWGRFRRTIEANTAELDASVENYDDALVLLLAEVASTYVQIRIFQQQLQYAADNIEVQSLFVKQAEDRLQGGAGRKIDQGQMRSNLYDTLAIKEQLEIGLRQANNQLCVLLGAPVRNLLPELGDGGIPIAPPEVAVGMPADLLRRRPDLRRAERLVAAQSARIGIATSDLYPRLSLIGGLGYEAANFGDLFTSTSFIGTIGPSLQWNILNYGRLLNGIRVQDALFQTAAVDYQNAVLSAGREVEDGIVLFLRSQSRTKQLAESAKEAKIAVDEAVQLSKDVKFDLNTAFVTSNFLVTQQDKLAQARGDIALGFIQIYKALGGGWEIRLPAPEPNPTPIPAPLPVPAPTELPPVPEMRPAAPNFLPPRATATAVASREPSTRRPPDRPWELMRFARKHWVVRNWQRELWHENALVRRSHAVPGVGRLCPRRSPSRDPCSQFWHWWNWTPVCPSTGCCPDDYVHKLFPSLCPLPCCGSPDDYCRKPLPTTASLPR